MNDPDDIPAGFTLLLCRPSVWQCDQCQKKFNRRREVITHCRHCRGFSRLLTGNLHEPQPQQEPEALAPHPLHNAEEEAYPMDVANSPPLLDAWQMEGNIDFQEDSFVLGAGVAAGTFLCSLYLN